MTPPGGDPPGGTSGETGDEELGEPIAELRDVALPLSDRFADRVRGRIERRVLTGDFLELFWSAPLTMLLEFLRWPFDAARDRRG